jgi:hypothetical protein
LGRKRIRGQAEMREIKRERERELDVKKRSKKKSRSPYTKRETTKTSTLAEKQSELSNFLTFLPVTVIHFLLSLGSLFIHKSNILLSRLFRGLSVFISSLVDFWTFLLCSTF